MAHEKNKNEEKFVFLNSKFHTLCLQSLDRSFCKQFKHSGDKLWISRYTASQIVIFRTFVRISSEAV